MKSFRPKNLKFSIFCCLGCALIPSTLTAAPPTKIKMATLAPDNSVLVDIFLDMGEEWKEATKGRVVLNIYSGVRDDEPTLVKKMEGGRLDAAAISVRGLKEIDRGFEIFAIPGFFDSDKEFYCVLQKISPQLRSRAEARGYILLNLGHVGWLHFFSGQRIQTVEDLKGKKLFVWAGDPEVEQMWKKRGFHPVPLLATDIRNGLQTGKIEAFFTTPSLALEMQWYREVRYMQKFRLAPLMGATVITTRIWESLSYTDREIVRSGVDKINKRLKDDLTNYNLQAVTEMDNRGLTVVPIPDAIEAEWRRAEEDLKRIRLENIEESDLLESAEEARVACRN